MSLARAELPAEPDALRAFALACQAELKAAELAVQLRTLEIEKLKFQIAKLRRMQFGRSSERITRQIEQLALQLEELETGEAEDIAKSAAEEPPSTRERKTPKRRPLPDHLPRHEVVHQPEADGACVCPDCGAGMAQLGEDVTEVLDYVPGRFQVIRHVRPKYACKACDAITQAPAPAMPTPRGRATPAMLAHLLVSKYCDHLPLYRQSEIYAREGVDLDRSTLCGWVGQAAWLLQPIVEGIKRHVFAAEKIHGDDTTVPVLASGLGRTKTGRLWVYVRDDRPFCGTAPPAAAYFYSPDRGGEHPAKHLASFSGFLQADGYAGFEALYNRRNADLRANRAITEVACWAHCRRKFFDVWDGKKSPVAKEAIERTATFYAIEPRRASRRRTSGWHIGRIRRRCSPRSSAGLTRSSPDYPRSRSWPRHSATPSSGERHSHASSPMRGSRSTTTSPKTPCAASHSGARITCSPDQIPVASAPPPCTRSCRPPNSTRSTRKLICATPSTGSPTAIRSAESTN